MDDLDGDVDRQLQRAGEDWRRRALSSFRASPTLPLQQQQRGSVFRRQPMIMIAAAAAVVAVVSVGIVLAVRTGSTNDDATASAHTASHGAASQSAVLWSEGEQIVSSSTAAPSPSSAPGQPRCGSTLAGIGRLEDLGLKVEFRSTGPSESPVSEMVLTAEAKNGQSPTPVKIKSAGEVYAVSTTADGLAFEGQSGALGLLPDPAEYQVDAAGDQAQVQVLPVVRACQGGGVLSGGPVNVIFLVEAAIADSDFTVYATRPYATVISSGVVQLPGN